MNEELQNTLAENAYNALLKWSDKAIVKDYEPTIYELKIIALFKVVVDALDDNLHK